MTQRRIEERERNALRFHDLEGLSLEPVGALYGVHRATVARWIAKTRDTLLSRTRELLRTRLQVSDAELQSQMNLVRSRLDISVRRIFDD